MERLTKRIDGIAVLESWAIDKDPVSIIQRLCNRLAAYEDTSLEPDVCAEYKKFEDEAVSKGVPFKRIVELMNAQQEGKLIVLPCKVGDRVWVDGREAVVENFFGYETERYLHAQFYDNMQYIDIPFDEIGKTVFLTREEAEAALKGGEG